jgi:DNA-binding NarL/FixJ family response regulator
MSAANEPKIRIVIGENHADLATSLAMLIDLQEDMQCVGTGASTKAVQELANAHDPDVFVLDLSLDDGSSVPLIRSLRASRPSTALLAYTGHSDPVLTEQCKEAGCDAVVTKAGAVDDLIDAIRSSALARRAR